MGRPLVAVSPYRFAPGRIGEWSDSGEAAPTAYLDALRRAGALPLVVGDPDDGVRTDGPQEVLSRVDGVLLLGGPDLDAGWYGQAPHPANYGIDVVRDRWEIDLARSAVESGVPVLGVCRGLQVLNVALGGTLHQHLPDLGGDVAHGVPIGVGRPAVHPVGVTAGSRLADTQVDAASIESCVSIHHQGVDRLAAGLRVTARSGDGAVEAVETVGGPGWCLAVQWHPERTAATDPSQQAIFAALVAAARR